MRGIERIAEALAGNCREGGGPIREGGRSGDLQIDREPIDLLFERAPQPGCGQEALVEDDKGRLRLLILDDLGDAMGDRVDAVRQALKAKIDVVPFLE